MFVANNFDYYAPGNIVPVLLSQPEIADSIRELRKQQGMQTARYLVENTAITYKLSVEQAQRFLNVHAAVYNLFNLGRHLVSAEAYRFFRLRSFASWKNAAAV